MKSFRQVALILGLFGICAGISGCAVESLPYPRLPTVKKLKNKIMSPEEREEAIRDLTAEQAQHQQSAIQEIEKPK